MAFRASRKPALPKTETTTSELVQEPPSEVSQAASLSIDDFIGSPVETRSEEAPVKVRHKAAAPVENRKPAESTQPPFVQKEMAQPRDNWVQKEPQQQYQQPQQNYQQPQQNYQHQSQSSHSGHGNGGGYGGGQQQGGYRGGNRYGGQQQQQGGGSGGYRRTGMRRDFAQVDAGFSQDINVPTETVRGILDVMPEGHGFLRPKFTPSDRDIYISQSQIRRFLLRNGDMVEGQARQPKENERYWGLLKVENINGKTAEEMVNRPKFEDLTPIYPNKLLILETGQLPLSTRIIDLVAPIGFGQRGLIVSPPKAGKTTIIKELAAGITANFPDVHLMAALIGERPEEVTDISRSVKGEVLASNFDQSPQEQTRIAEVALDRAKRLVEMGKDVVVLLDSITRLARAYNLVVNPSGRTLSGGFDPAALYPAKRFLGAARCVEVLDAEGNPQIAGSLTVIGTALVDTGSRMDDLIYEEFKGTGNMEIHLSRTLQERRIFPAIDIAKSGTRHDELLLGEEKMKKVTTLRHMLSMLSDDERTVMLIDKLGKTKSNDEFLESLAKG